MKPIENVLGRLKNHAKSGKGFRACCPSHVDRKPSLSVTEGDDGRVLLNCHAGCSVDDVVAALDLQMSDLYPDHCRARLPSRTLPQPAAYLTAEEAIAAYRLGKPDKQWSYLDASEQEVFRIVRWDTSNGKQIRPILATPAGWTLTAMPAPRPLLNLPALLADKEEPVYVVEGEKCFDALVSLGLLVTTSAAGANAAAQTDWSPLASRQVYVMPDNDEAGRKYAEDIVQQLNKLPYKSIVRVVELPYRVEGEDVADIVGRCKTPDELVRMRKQVVALSEVTSPVDDRQTKIDGAASLAEPNTWTDLGLSRRLIAESDGQLRFSPEEGVWFTWQGNRWERDPSGAAVQEVAKTVADRLQEEARKQSAAEIGNCMRFALMAGSQARIKAMSMLARSDQRIAVRSAEMDADPYLLNCPNGVLDLKNGVLLPHSPQHLLSRITRVEYDPQAACPRWERFIQEVTCDNEDLAGFLQRTFGLAISGYVSDQFLWIHHGDGANGKTTCLEVLSAILGDYSGPIGADLLAMNPKTFERERGRAVHSLVGKRLAVAGESGPDARLSEGLIKMLTGGDTVEAREIYGKAFTVHPTWHIHLCTNHRPSVRGLDHGVWRRLLVVPWAAFFDGQRADLNLRNHLLDEASGILNWLVQGFHDWKSRGLSIPKIVRESHDEYQRDCDPLGHWLDECCEMDPQAVTKSKELYSRYKQWVVDAGENPMTKQAFGHSLGRRGLRGEKMSGSRVWFGVRLVQT